MCNHWLHDGPASLSTRQRRELETRQWLHAAGQMTSFTYTTYIHATPSGLAGPSPTPPSRGATGGTKGLARKDLSVRTGRRARPTTWRTEAGLVGERPRAGDPRVRSLRQLAYTWHTFTPEWAAQSAWTKPPLSWRAEPLQGRLRHRGHRARRGEAHGHPRRLRAGSDVLQGISNGWPAVLPA